MIASSYFRLIMARIFLLGFASGLPIAMTASTLQAYLHDNGVTLANIGLFSLASVPYSFKFLWAPLLDKFKLPIINALGRRKSWIIFFQGLLILLIYLMGSIDIQKNLLLLGSIVLLTSFASASQDIVIDAFRIEMLDEKDQGLGVAAATLGYRIGALVSGAGALYIAHYHGWHTAYLSVISMMIIAVFFTLSCPEKLYNYENDQETSGLAALKNSFLKPFIEFSNRNGWWNVLLFIALFKMSDAFAGVMTNSFLMDIGFNKKEIAEILKLYGAIATLVGSIIGGSMLKNLSCYKALFISAILQMLSNLVFVIQAYYGHNIILLATNVSIENLASGISTTVLVSYISNICNRQFAATQYALLSSIAGLARSTLASSSGKFAELCGWSNFFIISSILSLPSIYFLNLIFKKQEKNADQFS